eukprot:CAMPEP_0116871032 /NCGR_PEP_ID=MMETSP0463-20121206/1206_1 /TAXON_ID=181622 /ORGANISM="Strombidinopsis sp, Strain SopsisLIS2011" /LENGTH=59 /DNA_ID=CAMNT_0004508695 /DNA_START=760 /DNA_END=939 /DNA_ORIENTATION=-
MVLENVDLDTNGTKRDNLDKFFKVGRLPETGRKEVVLDDIEKKQAYLIELLAQKEEVEE